jgi:hypothetical protein
VAFCSLKEQNDFDASNCVPKKVPRVLPADPSIGVPVAAGGAPPSTADEARDAGALTPSLLAWVFGELLPHAVAAIATTTRERTAPARADRRRLRITRPTSSARNMS